ncbi:MAG: hypothetical protein ACI89L_002526 [Phycisphaerales bacterium]|jgi:hypothetical protein
MRERGYYALAIALIVMIAMWVGVSVLNSVRPVKLMRGSAGPLQSTGLREYQVLTGLGFRRFSVWRQHESTGYIVVNDAHGDGFTLDMESRIPKQLPHWIRIPGYLETPETVWGGLAIGWPAPAIRSLESLDYGKPNSPAARDTVGVLSFLGVNWPIDPIWRGIIIDVLFWWLLAFAVLSIPLRPWLRRRKGRCPKCAYDLKGDFAAGCPECGWGRDAVSKPAPSVNES